MKLELVLSDYCLEDSALFSQRCMQQYTDVELSALGMGYDLVLTLILSEAFFIGRGYSGFSSLMFLLDRFKELVNGNWSLYCLLIILFQLLSFDCVFIFFIGVCAEFWWLLFGVD